MSRKQKIQLIEKEITKPNQAVRISEDLDTYYKYLSGIAILWTMGKGHIMRSCTLNSNELFPRDFEVSFIQSNTYVAPNDRFFKLCEKAEGADFEMDFVDGGLMEQTKYPYTLKIYLLLENEQ